MNEDKYFYLHSQDISTYYLKCLLFLWKRSKLKKHKYLLWNLITGLNSYVHFYLVIWRENNIINLFTAIPSAAQTLASCIGHSISV